MEGKNVMLEHGRKRRMPENHKNYPNAFKDIKAHTQFNQ
jgi:hypothetical protein